MNAELKRDLKSFVPEVLVYAALVAAYCLLAVHYLAGTLHRLFQHHRVEYAFLALGLMIVQGYVLERLAHGIWLAVSGRRKVRQ